MIGNLTIDKANSNMSYFLYSIKILSNSSGKVSRKEFVETMADFVGKPPQKDGKENRTLYNKSNFPRYFGFIDLAKDSEGKEVLVLTKRGTKLADIISEHPDQESKSRYHIKPENQPIFTKMLLESILFDSFGKNNHGVKESRSDVEPPKVLFKTLSLLEKATAYEIYYILYSLNNGIYNTYNDAINAVRANREVGRYDYSSILEEWGQKNSADDCKGIKIFTDDSVRLIVAEEDEKSGEISYKLNPQTTKCYRKEIEMLSPVYAPLQMTIHADSLAIAERWVGETILGRIYNWNCVTVFDRLTCVDSEIFIQDTLIPAIAKAYNDEKLNHYLIIKNADSAQVAELFGKWAPLLVREDDFTSDVNGFSANSVTDEASFNKLIAKLTRNAQRYLTTPKIMLPSNFHIVSIESEAIDMSREYDCVFKQCLVDTGGPTGSKAPLLQKVLPALLPRTEKRFPLNSILYGAPGTGKTYSTAQRALAIAEGKEYKTTVEEDREKIMARYNTLINEGRIVFTTFHQSYGYEDFIQGLRPESSGVGMKFETRDGVFKRIADAAMQDPENNYVIIIDEINRANISKVFGELITLIEEDKRWGEVNALKVTLPSGDPFAIPNNLYIVGTMNSADKSISLIDTALRRRFEFIEVEPNAKLIKDDVLRSVLEKLNASLAKALDSTDLLIGHAYFLGKTEDDLCDILNRSIIPLLYEYFYDNRTKVKDQIKNALPGGQYVISGGDVGRIKVSKA